MAHNPEGRHSPDIDRPNMNLVLCGSDTTLTMAISKMLRGKMISPSDERAVSEDCAKCVKKEEKISGRQLSVVELPALSRLSEEEVMRQTLLSVTLCHPGVHAFIIIVPLGPLTDEGKSEIETILKIFDSKEHFVMLFTTQVKVEEFATKFVKINSESQSLISRCGGRYKLMGLKEPEDSKQIPDLLDYIENMKTEPYSLHMFVNAQKNRVRRETEEKYEEELKRIKDEITELQQKIQSHGAECSDDLKCLRIVLIGRTGRGKSATGNTILGREEFVSEASMDSVTTVCIKGAGEEHGQSVSVVDTPGLFDTTLKNEQVAEEIMKCVSLSSPGPHVFLIVLSVGRVTKEETDTLDLIKKIFGPKAAQFSIVLFTRGDELGNESVEDYVRLSNSAELKKLIRDCGNRFLVFNNREKQDRTQVIQLIKMIEEVKNTNQGQYFTNSMFEETEMNIKYRMEEIMKEREREIEAQREKMRVKYNRVMKDMTKKFEDDKNQEADKEIMKMEKQFKEEEVQLRKEFEEEEKTEKKKQDTEYQEHLEEGKQQRAEYHQKTKELKRDDEREREKEREEDRKREEINRQDQEKMKNEQECNIQELKMKQEEEIKKRDLEKKQRNEDEEEERQKWKRRIKEAENDRKEIQEEIKRQQREWEDEKKRQMREREEEERNLKEKHKEQLREKQEEMEKMRKRFEREREEERQKMEEEREKQRREREREYEEKKQEMKRHYEQQEQEREETWERRKREYEERREEERKRWSKKFEDLREEQERKRREKEDEERKKLITKREENEREYKEKMKRYYEQLERERKEEWERRKRDEEEIREEERKRWKKMIEDLNEEQEVELKRRESKRIRREEVEQDEMKQKYDDKIMETKKKLEDEVRKKEEEFNRRETLHHNLEEKINTLQKQVEQKNKSDCAII